MSDALIKLFESFPSLHLLVAIVAAAVAIVILVKAERTRKSSGDGDLRQLSSNLSNLQKSQELRDHFSLLRDLIMTNESYSAEFRREAMLSLDKIHNLLSKILDGMPRKPR
jgi:predicted RND superfamily exporter protein